MPTLNDLEAKGKVNILAVGESGAGKTGALASLVDAGYNLRILDFDRGLTSLSGFVRDKSKLQAVHYKTFEDKLKPGPKGLMLMGATAFANSMKALDNWQEADGTSLGPVTDWTTQDVLVVDSLSFMGRAALNNILFMNGYLDKPPEIQHWGMAMDNLERVIGRLTSSEVPCHVIMNTHIDLREAQGGGISRAYPMALGAKLSPKVGAFFDNLIAFRTSNTGKREIRTKTDGLLVCKTARPCPDTLPIETGMADLFDYLLGRKVAGGVAPCARAAGPTPASKSNRA